jgi:hypothetical protein
VMQGYMQVLLSLDMEGNSDVDNRMQITMISMYTTKLSSSCFSLSLWNKFF